MTDIDGIEPGLAGSVAHTVTSDDTAIALGSGDVPVLATPRAVALVEEAACTALIGHLAPDHTTVGVHIELDHLLPTQVGGEVTAAATLEQVDGRKLTFVVSVREDGKEVARGRHRRVVVARERFAG